MVEDLCPKCYGKNTFMFDSTPERTINKCLDCGYEWEATEMSGDLKKVLKEVKDCPNCKKAKEKRPKTVAIDGIEVDFYMCKKHRIMNIALWQEWIRQGKP